MDNVIFLDIDGVMKPARLYLDASVPKVKAGFCPTAVAAVNRIAERCSAGIVFNSTWNAFTDPCIFKIARSEGIAAPILGKTKYPYNENRLSSINEWIAENGCGNWVSLDDAEIKSDNAVWVNPEYGIGLNNYCDATKILGNYDAFIVCI